MHEIPRAIGDIVQARNKRVRRIRKFLRAKLCYKLCFGKHSDAFWAIFFVSIITILTRYSYKVTGLLEVGVLAIVLSMILAIFIYTIFSRLHCERISDRIDLSLNKYEQEIQSKIHELSENLGFKVELTGEVCSWMQDLYIKAGEAEDGLEYLDNTDTKCVRRYITKDK